MSNDERLIYTEAVLAVFTEAFARGVQPQDIALVGVRAPGFDALLRESIASIDARRNELAELMKEALPS